MKTSGSLQALRRVNPRAKDGFAQSVQATAHTVHARIVTAGADAAAGGGRPSSRRRVARVATVAASLVVAGAAAAFLMVGSPGVTDAAAAVKHAATVTAASAEQSGTAAVRITHGGRIWAGDTIRWHGRDLAVTRDFQGRPGPGSKFVVVNGTMYGQSIRGGWVKLGDPSNIDPDSGETPDEYLAAVAEDVGGVTVRRITDGMTGLTTRRLGDGSTAYSGTVAAGLIARETGFKEGQRIRVLPFGLVAHDEAANPASALHAKVTVGADGVVREIRVTWGGGASAWTWTVSYSRLGSTPAPVAPSNARNLRDVLRSGELQGGSGK